MAGVLGAVFCFLSVATSLWCGVASGDTMAERERVLGGMLQNLGQNGAMVRPDADDPNSALVVTISFAITTVGSLDPKTGRVQVNGYLYLGWKDPRLAFSDVSNVTAMRVNADRVWTPDVELYNVDAPGLQVLTRQDQVVVYSSGDVMWIPLVSVTSLCRQVDTTPTTFTCYLKFGSWAHNGNDIDVKPQYDTLDLLDYSVTGQWRVTGAANATRNVKTYACCPEPYPDVTFSFSLQERGTAGN